MRKCPGQVSSRARVGPWHILSVLTGRCVVRHCPADGEGWSFPGQPVPQRSGVWVVGSLWARAPNVSHGLLHAARAFSHVCYLTGFFHYFHRYFLSAYYVPACARHWRHRWKIAACYPLSWCSSPCEVGIATPVLLMKRWALKGVGRLRVFPQRGPEPHPAWPPSRGGHSSRAVPTLSGAVSSTTQERAAF